MKEVAINATSFKNGDIQFFYDIQFFMTVAGRRNQCQSWQGFPYKTANQR